MYLYIYVFMCTYVYIYTCIHLFIYLYKKIYKRYPYWKGSNIIDIGWQRLIGSFKVQVSFAKEPYKRDHILQRRPIF